MLRGNVVFYVTRQYMRLNKKRTMTTFIGIVFTVLLMTCVFVGKDTAINFMGELASNEDGKWHTAIYGVTREEEERIKALPYVKETSISTDVGITDFPSSENKERPYLNIKAYGEKNFQWRNIDLTEGRYPKKKGEILLSESIREDQAQVQTGDTIKAEFFQRFITGTSGGTTYFPFFQLKVKDGETVEASWDFPYYEENDSFREEKEYTGETASYTVVGFMEPPSFEKVNAAAYTGITFLDDSEDLTGTYNLTMMFDLDKLPDLFSLDFREIAGEKETEINDFVMTFSSNSSNGTINLMMDLMTIFFVVLIIAVSIVLIYNVFNLSFKERSRYLGMLSSVGATAGQKRSSIYYEAFVLLLAALPVGILGGMGIVKAGMGILKPYLLRFMSMANYVEEIPVKLSVSPEDIGVVVLVSTLTVLVSSLLPAKKIGKIGAIECIRGNTEVKKKAFRLNEKRLRRFGAEGLLAYNTIKRQRRKTGSVRRAAIVFMVILLSTAFGSDVLRVVAEKKLGGNVDFAAFAEEGESSLHTFPNTPEDIENFRALTKELQENPSVERISRWYRGMFVGKVGVDTYSQEYWSAYHDIFNQYYHRELSEQEFWELVFSDFSQMNILAVDDTVLEKMAKACGADYEALIDRKNPGAIVIQEGALSTDNVGVAGQAPQRYRYFDLDRMTDLQMGDTIEAKFYSLEKEEDCSFPLRIAGFGNNKTLKDFLEVNSQYLWVIISEDACFDIMDIMGMEEGTAGFDWEARIKMGQEDRELVRQLKELSEKTGGSIFYSDWNETDMREDLADIILSVTDILLFCFVVLVSVICFMNLYNSIGGWMADRQGELAALESVGMTRAQTRKMLLWECGRILAGSILWAVSIAGVIIFGIWNTMSSLFGNIRFSLPLIPFVIGVGVACGAVILITLYSYGQRKERNMLDYIRNESI